MDIWLSSLAPCDSSAATTCREDAACVSFICLGLMVVNEAAAAALGSIFPFCRIGYARLEEIFIDNGLRGVGQDVSLSW